MANLWIFNCTAAKWLPRLYDSSTVSIIRGFANISAARANLEGEFNVGCPAKAYPSMLCYRESWQADLFRQNK